MNVAGGTITYVKQPLLAIGATSPTWVKNELSEISDDSCYLSSRDHERAYHVVHFYRARSINLTFLRSLLNSTVFHAHATVIWSFAFLFLSGFVES